MVVGLGNPGLKYAKNRHNVGFMAVDDLAEHLADAGVPSPVFKEQFKGRFASVLGGPTVGRCFLLKPMTYMNASGDSVVAAAAYNKVESDRVIVLHDEIDFAFGRVAIKKGGGHGGHNGLRDIAKKLGTPDFVRIRMGVGRPTHGEVSHWVLSDFSTPDVPHVPEMIEQVRRATKAVLADGVAAAMNQFNAAAG